MKQQMFVLSCDGIHTLSGVVYLPQGEAKGFFHIVHGMTEHIGRYGKLMQDMAEEGYIAFGYDHLGHGSTAKDESEWGYIAAKDGDEMLCRDVKIFADAVRQKYGQDNADLPYCLMGHSMGSFVTRRAVATCVKPDKYIIMGTGGKNPAAGAGLTLIGMLKLLYGDRHISPFIDNMAFGSYNKRFGGGTPEDPSPWLTRDEEERKKYYAQPACTFKFTISAMGDLIRLIKKVNRASWYKQVPCDMPVLLVSGEQDPVGNYGKGVKEVYEKLLATGHDASCILYPDARHEILNDTTYEQVRTDILEFLN